MNTMKLTLLGVVAAVAVLVAVGSAHAVPQPASSSDVVPALNPLPILFEDPEPLGSTSRCLGDCKRCEGECSGDRKRKLVCWDGCCRAAGAKKGHFRMCGYQQR